MNIKTINPIGTAWEGRDFECITLHFGILYAPSEHLVFYPNPSGEYGWDRISMQNFPCKLDNLIVVQGSSRVYHSQTRVTRS